MFEGLQPNAPRRMPEVPQGLPAQETLYDIDDAREYVAELVMQGKFPIITVPLEHVETIQTYGISSVPKHDLLTGSKFSFVAGVIGLEPYLPEGQSRAIFSVDPAQVRSIEPRFTGKDKAFHGVVGFPDGVPASALSLQGIYSQEEWEMQRAAQETKEKGSLQ